MLISDRFFSNRNIRISLITLTLIKYYYHSVPWHLKNMQTLESIDFFTKIHSSMYSINAGSSSSIILEKYFYYKYTWCA